MTMAQANPGAWTRRLAWLAIIAALLVLLAGPTIRFGVLPWQAGLGMFVLAALVAGIAGLVCLVALLRRRGGLMAVVGAAAGLAAFVVPVAIIAAGRNVPPINDITTDTANPPVFEAITATMRGPGSAPLAYDPAMTPQQQAGYPDLKPLQLPDAPAAAFPRALAAARAMGWTIVAADAATGRIEATDLVPWWGFKDDVVIRLEPLGTGTRIDMRSKSRVGQGDVGVNAKRITDYFARVRAG